MADDGFDGGPSPEFLLDLSVDAALLAGFRDSPKVGCVVVAAALIDISPLDLAADAFPPMAHPGAFVRLFMLENSSPVRCWKWGRTPKAPTPVRPRGRCCTSIHVKHDAHEHCRAIFGGKTLRRLLIEPSPVDLVRQGRKLALHVDDLIKMGAKQVTMPRLFLLFRPLPISSNKGSSRNHETNRI